MRPEGCAPAGLFNFESLKPEWDKRESHLKYRSESARHRESAVVSKVRYLHVSHRRTTRRLACAKVTNNSFGHHFGLSIGTVRLESSGFGNRDNWRGSIDSST